MSYNLDRLELLDYEQGEHLWPAITYASVTNYFLHKPCHDGEATKAYKSTDAYQYVKSGMCLPAAEQSAAMRFSYCAIVQILSEAGILFSISWLFDL